MRKSRKSYDLDFKKKIVAEYISGTTPADELARREGLERFQIYAWKTQLERRGKVERFEELTNQGHNPDDVRRIMDLEEELEAAKAKIADLTLANDLLKKIHPSFQSEKRSSGYAELRAKVTRSKGRAR
jgi:transposase-like protein